MKKDFVMRGQTAHGLTETLNFSGHKTGMAYKMTEFKLYPSTNIGNNNFDGHATVTAAKTAESTVDPNFNNEGLIAVATYADNSNSAYGPSVTEVVNDTFLITQNLILKVTDEGGASTPVNWQCRFEAVKMNASEETVNNYKQFMISDGS